MLRTTLFNGSSLRYLSHHTTHSLPTLLAHAGIAPSSNNDGLAPALNLSTTYERNADNSYNSHVYSRLSNPTRDALEQEISNFETCYASRPPNLPPSPTSAFASGMAAVSSVLLARPNTTVLLPDDCYHGVPYQLDAILHRCGVTFELIDMTDHYIVENKLKTLNENEGANSSSTLLWLETPSNPLCKITDLSTLTGLAHAISPSIAVCVDATWSPPTLTQPFSHGADVVLHSATKFMGGHSDVLAGVVTSNGGTEAGLAMGIAIREYQGAAGGVCSPFDAWLVLRGLRSMDVRVERMCNNAQTVAEYLTRHPNVEICHYPGLPSHPGHKVAEKQMKRFGSMLSFEVVGGEPAAVEMAGRLQLIRRATSLGGTETLIEHRASIEPEARRISPEGLLRVSVGLEGVDDIIQDLQQALR